MNVKRTEQIWLKPSKTLRHFCHLSKNLYNQANYLIKQVLAKKEKEECRWLRYQTLYHLLKTSPNYRALPAQSAQQTLKFIDRNWKSFFEAIKEWKKDPEKFKAKPEPPKFKPKNGEYILVFTNQQIRMQRNHLKFPQKVGLEVKTRLPKDTNLREVRIIPKGVGYVLEIVYEKEIPPEAGNYRRVVGIDLGVHNLVTMVNNFGEQPIVIKGGVAKSINQYYNKQRAWLQRIYERQGIKMGTKLKKLTAKRDRKLHNHFHKVSRFIVDWCVQHDVGMLVIGYNTEWKQHANMGRKTNQNFVQLPFSKLIQQIEYKAEEKGIHVLLQEESHTSKCSFLDQEPIDHQEAYMGKRKSRGLFKSANGILINADVNGAYNIIRKAIPKAFPVDGIEGVGLHPERYQGIFRRWLISA
ncbi:MAG: RNA-guided endonuclease InsQ/TnpB family protein [Candidatus Heimdallarchaeota archaeon]